MFFDNDGIWKNKKIDYSNISGLSDALSGFYPASNPSGFITGVENVVYTTGSQTISGAKEFSQRPTVNGTGVLLEGEIQSNTIISGVVYSAQVNVKNGEGNTIYKGQPVYIKDADGSNIIVGLASNSGEQTSSKTLGLLVQDSLADNAFGTVITDGLLEGFNASAANAGDPIWLGPTGSLIYGLTNKPYAPNHLVYLGVVTRAQNNGELFVKVQNGYELEELHNVAVTGAVSGQFLFKNSNNQWVGKNPDISNISGLQSSLDSKITANIGPNTQSAPYTLQLTDAGKYINISTGGVTIPSGIFNSGDVVSIYNNSATNQTITQGAGVTMYLAGTPTIGDRVLAQRGIATILCVGSNTFTIIGGGLS